MYHLFPHSEISPTKVSSSILVKEIQYKIYLGKENRKMHNIHKGRSSMFSEKKKHKFIASCMTLCRNCLKLSNNQN